MARMTKNPAAMAREERKGERRVSNTATMPTKTARKGQDRSQGEGYSNEDDHAVAAAEAGKDGLPVASDGGAPGEDEGAFGNTQETGKLDGQKSLYNIPGKDQDAVAPADIPEDVGSAGAGAAGGKDVDSPAPGEQVGQGNGAKQVADHDGGQQFLD